MRGLLNESNANNALRIEEQWEEKKTETVVMVVGEERRIKGGVVWRRQRYDGGDFGGMEDWRNGRRTKGSERCSSVVLLGGGRSPLRSNDAHYACLSESSSKILITVTIANS